ncbi:MAG TPA: response regulator [Candidatus Krumholzibacteria bacterium]|nr:response regulator [Candidatus Krumholzibacteria bacterium]
MRHEDARSPSAGLPGRFTPTWGEGDRVGPSGAEPTARAEDAQQGACILVVDDNALNCELFEAMLVPEGYRVEQAFSGPEALALAERLRPDMILLDVNMPGMDGFEVARRLRAGESTRLIPIVMVTALGDLDHRVRGLEAGADDYLAKPVSQAELVARVQSTLRLTYLHRQVDERQKLELVLGDVSDGILILDAQGRVREVSPSARRWLELPRDVQHLTEAWGRLEGAPDDLDIAIRRGEARDFVLERSEPPLFLRASLRPVRDPQGNATGAVLSVRDVTRERLEHKLQQDVLSLMSHKLRTPLTVVTSWTEVLLEGGCGELQEPQKQALGAIAGAATQLRSVLDGIFTHMEWTRRLQHLKRRRVGFAAIAAELQSKVHQHLGEKAPVTVKAAEGEIVVDHGLFVDALLELVRNAVKFGGPAVQVHVHLHRDAQGPVVEVSDNGLGIPAEHLERIFERFYQVEPEFTGQIHGLGLGLSMVKRAMDGMGAVLSVHSQLQRGTRFTIRF